MNEEIKALKQKVKDMKVIYVEDEDDMRIGTEMFLNKFFNFVEIAENGQDGLQKFKDGDFNIVFTDILMPKMNGLDMIRNIKKYKKNIFCIALTASEINKENIENNVNLYFRKPISYNNMIVIMKEIIKKFDL